MTQFKIALFFCLLVLSVATSGYTAAASDETAYPSTARSNRLPATKLPDFDTELNKCFSCSGKGLKVKKLLAEAGLNIKFSASSEKKMHDAFKGNKSTFEILELIGVHITPTISLNPAQLHDLESNLGQYHSNSRKVIALKEFFSNAQFSLTNTESDEIQQAFISGTPLNRILESFGVTLTESAPASVVARSRAFLVPEELTLENWINWDTEEALKESGFDVKGLDTLLPQVPPSLEPQHLSRKPFMPFPKPVSLTKIKQVARTLEQTQVPLEQEELAPLDRDLLGLLKNIPQDHEVQIFSYPLLWHSSNKVSHVVLHRLAQGATKTAHPLDWKQLLGQDTMSDFLRAASQQGGSDAAREFCLTRDIGKEFRSQFAQYFISNGTPIGLLPEDISLGQWVLQEAPIAIGNLGFQESGSDGLLSATQGNEVRTGYDPISGQNTYHNTIDEHNDLKPFIPFNHPVSRANISPQTLAALDPGLGRLLESVPLDNELQVLSYPLVWNKIERTTTSYGVSETKSMPDGWRHIVLFRPCYGGQAAPQIPESDWKHLLSADRLNKIKIMHSAPIDKKMQARAICSQIPPHLHSPIIRYFEDNPSLWDYCQANPFIHSSSSLNIASSAPSAR